MGCGYKIIWNNNKEQLHAPEDDTFENANELEYKEDIGLYNDINYSITHVIDDVPIDCRVDSTHSTNDLATRDPHAAFASCKDMLSTIIGGFQCQFIVKKFANEVHSHLLYILNLNLVDRQQRYTQVSRVTCWS